jgi:hypothetical protein
MTRVLLLTLVALILPSGVQAQRDTGLHSGPVVLRMSLLFQPSAVAEISTEICPGSEVALELGGGIRISRWVSATVFGRVHNEVFAEKCVDGLVPTPTDSGTFVFTDYSGVESYPYVSAGMRLTVFSGSTPGAGFRLFGGGEWLPGRSVIGPLFGVGLSVPADGVLLVAEVETRVLSVPYEQHEITFRQGQAIGERREAQNSDSFRVALRFGVEFGLGK